MHPFIPVLSPSFLYHPYIPSFKSKDFSFTCTMYMYMYNTMNCIMPIIMVFLQEQEDGQTTTPSSRCTEEWMLICRQHAHLQPSMDTENIDWTLAAQSYPNIEEAPSFILQQCQAAGQHTFTTTADRRNLRRKQLQVYTIVQQHHSANSPPPLKMTVSGTAVIPHPLPPTSPAETPCGCSSDCCGFFLILISDTFRALKCTVFSCTR